MQLFVTTVLLLMLAFLAPPGFAKPSGYGYRGYHHGREQYKRPFEMTDIDREDEQPRENNLNDQMQWPMMMEDASDYGDEDYNPETLRTNRFTLKLSGLSNLKFDVEGHSVTDGQPWKGLTFIECKTGECFLNIESGRKKSNKVSNWFKNAIGGGSAIACDNYDTLPGKLNFAIRGTMKFNHGGNTYVGKDFVIAQGNNARGRNNWWIGGKNLATVANQPGILAAAAQTFNYGPGNIMPAKVTFMAAIGCVSNMQMGVIKL